MKNTKLIFPLVIVTCLYILCSCNKNSTSEEITDNKKIIYIGSDIYSPFFIEDGDGYYTGIDVLLASEAFSRMGYKAVFKKIEWKHKNDYLKNKEVDCLWGSFTMTGRENDYLWAGPYMNSRQIVAVPTNSDIYSLSDLYNKRIGVQITTKPDEIFSTNSDSRIPAIRKLYCFSRMEYVFAALRKDYVDAIAGHETAFLDFMYNSSTHKDYRILNEILLDGKTGVAFSKDYDKTLVESLTNTLIQMKQDGFIASILSKYNIDVKNALDGVLNEK